MSSLNRPRQTNCIVYLKKFKLFNIYLIIVRYMVNSYQSVIVRGNIGVQIYFKINNMSVLNQKKFNPCTVNP